MTTVEIRTETVKVPVARVMDRDEVVQAIVREAQAAGVMCTAHKANSLVEMLDDVVRVARHTNYVDYHHVSGMDLEYLHEVMDVIMPDDVMVPLRDSAHDLVNRHLLNGDIELSLVHTRDRTRPVEYCAITVHVESSF